MIMIVSSTQYSAFPFFCHCYPSLAVNFDMIIIRKNNIENDDDDKHRMRCLVVNLAYKRKKVRIKAHKRINFA